MATPPAKMASLPVHPSPSIPQLSYPLSPSHPNPSLAQFAPRKEFLKDQHTFSTFSLLALSGSGLVRLYSFPIPLVSTLRAFFEHRKLAGAFREVPTQNLYEISLEGRPWATAKSNKTEKLILDILAIIFRHGYTFLSTVDYGREQDDRLAIAFSKPAVPLPSSGSRPGSPVPGLPTTVSPVAPGAPKFRVPFGISFSSPTLLRVVNPPLNSTPAILQAVRSAWPRGVVSEKKIDTSFEFKLKGYRWFQEDTFAIDSLQHILSLLSSLDAHGFRLMSSLSLANRSRIKDLWIFTGSGSDMIYPELTPPSTPNSSSVELRRGSGSADTPPRRHSLDPTAGPSGEGPSFSGGGRGSGHSRLATMPAITAQASASTQSLDAHKGHVRSVSESAAGAPKSSGRAVLRKPARASVLSIANPDDSPARRPGGLPTMAEEHIRASLPSEVGSVHNMTGIGAGHLRGSRSQIALQNPHPQADLIYTTAEREHECEREGSPASSSDAEQHALRQSSSPASIAAYYQGQGSFTPSVLYTQSPLEANSNSQPRTPPIEQADSPPRLSAPPHTAPAEHPQTPTPPLLGLGAFRDSAFSSSTCDTREVPIAWTGTTPERESSPPPRRPPMPSAYASMGPQLPGAWQPTPKNENPPSTGGVRTPPANAPITNPYPSAAEEKAALHLRMSRTSPERKAVHARVSSPGYMSAVHDGRKSEAADIMMMPTRMSEMPARPGSAPGHRSSEGWVVVNVDPNGDGQTPWQRPRSSSHPNLVMTGYPSPSNGHANGHAAHGPDQGTGPMNAAAKAIVIIDAVDQQGQKGDKSGMKRFFSLSRSEADEAKKAKTRSRSGSGQKKSLLGRLK